MKPHRFSSSMKRATISFTDPDIGRSTHQENAGCVDTRLRAAIKAAQRAFNAEYYGKLTKRTVPDDHRETPSTPRNGAREELDDDAGNVCPA